MADVLLIYAPSPNPMTVLYPDLTKIQPLGICSIAAVLIRAGISVEICDLWCKQINEKYFEDLLLKKQPKIVGFSAMTDNYLNSLRLAKVCKSVDENIKTIIGGPHVSFTDEQTLQDSSDIDIVARGEGEITMLELCKLILQKEHNSFSNIRGITYRDENSKIIKNSGRPLIENLDTLPYPARELLGPIQKNVGIQTGRGCPGGCKFCVASAMSGGRVRTRSVENVVNEIIELKVRGAERFNFLDDTFTCDIDRLKEIMELLKEKGYSIKWSAESRVDIVDKDETIFEYMAGMGCEGVQFGVESGSQEILNSINKKTNLSQIERSVKLARDAGLQVFCSMMVGLPEDTEETINKTIDFGEYLCCKYGTVTVFSITTPYPGTYIYRKAKDIGLNIYKASYNQYTVINSLMDTKNLSRYAIKKFHYDGMMRVSKYLPKQLADTIQLVLPKEDICLM